MDAAIFVYLATFWAILISLVGTVGVATPDALFPASHLVPSDPVPIALVFPASYAPSHPSQGGISCQQVILGTSDIPFSANLSSFLGLSVDGGTPLLLSPSSADPPG